MQKLISISLILWAALTFATDAQAQSALKDHDTYQPLDVTAERLELRQNPSRAVYIGAVKVIQGNLTMTADTLSIFYAGNKDSKEDPTIHRFDAQGKVSFVSPTESLSGNWAVYDVSENLITLGGDVVLTQNNNVLRGERLEFDLVSGLAKLDGQVRGKTDGRVRGRFSIPDKDK
ncbi:LptA/OstA family protein [Kordiimonas laminariae]|uniref:LptA/OstA family protein n=1 Tax=Kordiimonas laminariae TaxID=2917717 RepID=UPI001FF37AAF|nr:LptA/OstA family protein [Kordiimonas laminariae]MCK0070073.1 hypothetical protein [Kordiimonas laminariae]